jgi:hypothetical protein
MPGDSRYGLLFFRISSVANVEYFAQDFTFTILPFITFALTAIITTPPNYLFQEWLESTFPTLISNGTRRDDNHKQRQTLRRSKKNVLMKFIIDQTLGAATNTIVFIALTSLFKGNGVGQIVVDVQDNFVEMFMAGWRMWPFVSFANLSFVPWEWRPVVGNTAGLCWGVYVTLMNS